jgi:hypothetical protein
MRKMRAYRICISTRLLDNWFSLLTSSFLGFFAFVEYTDFFLFGTLRDR